MNKRTVSLLVSMSLIFVGMLLFSNVLFPPNPQPANVARQDAGKDVKDDGDNPVDANSNANKSDQIGEQTDQGADRDAPRPVSSGPQRFFTIGSLEEKSKERYLITFSSRGGALLRVELNSRDRNGKQRYRDLVHFGGYIGKLELQDIDGRVVVGVVGPGTPAAIGGLRSGDVIVAFNGEPVVSPDDFDRLLKKIKPDANVELQIARKEIGGELTQTLQITSDDQPLELLHPERDPFDVGLTSPPSFLVTLRKPSGEGSKSDTNWPEVDELMKLNDWDVAETTFEGRPAIEFAYTVSDELAKKAGLSGPVQVIKRYWLPEINDEIRPDANSRTFHINLQLIVKNLADVKQSLALQVDGPTGATTEGWWYQNKIHGSSTAIGYTAGARDIVWGNGIKPFYFNGCPQIVTGIQKSNFQWIANPNLVQTEPGYGELKFVGVDTQYFNISLLPANGPDNTRPVYSCYSAMAGVASAMIPTAASYRRLVDCTFYLFEKYDIEAQSSHSQRYEIFAGPKEVGLLQTYGLEDTRVFGWFAGFSKFLCWLLTVLYKATFSLSYGIAIILLTVIVRILIIPLSRKAALNAQMMQLLAPEMKTIADKYKDDMDKRAQAQRELFRRHKYNPFGGCLLVFLQLPVFIGLYRGLSVDIVLRDKPLIPGLSWCSNLAAPDSLFYWKDWMPGFLANETGWFGPWFNVLPLVTIVLFLIQQKMFTPPPADEQQAFAHKMMTFMMIFMGVLFFKVPSGLCIYFITSSIWGLAERKFLPKPKLSDDRVKSIKDTLSTSPSDSGRPQLEASEGLFARIKGAIEQKTQGTPRPVDSEELRRQDRDRKRKLKERGF